MHFLITYIFKIIFDSIYDSILIKYMLIKYIYIYIL